MGNELLMSLLTGLLVAVGFLQLIFLKSQNRQNQLNLLQEYRNRWKEYHEQLCIMIFLGRDDGDFYQLANPEFVKTLNKMVKNNSKYQSQPTSWAREAVNDVCNTLSDVCIRIMQGQLNIQDVYPLFGSNLLRHSRPLRVILDVESIYNQHDDFVDRNHLSIRREVQDWLIYHDGIRRRCLILIDVLWAEAVRLGDLPPDDIRSGAEAKLETGELSRRRLKHEFRKINKTFRPFLEKKLINHLKNSEYKKHKWGTGVINKDLDIRNKHWLKMLLRE